MNNLRDIRFVNKIVDNVRCVTCGKLQGIHGKSLCGHITCDDCVTYDPDCRICTSPLQKSNTSPKWDRTFHHKRLSEHLRIEKELFPNCIQAPMKYENKRKRSLNISKSKCSTIFPGEEVTCHIDMANTTNYVQQWLGKNETNITRKPFSDLNVNTSWSNKPKSKNKDHNGVENVFLDVIRKRTLSRTTDGSCSLKRNKKSFYKCNKILNTDSKKSKAYKQNNNIGILEKSDNNESGIFMEMEQIVIDDSQENIIDKDKNAWLAVLKACKNDDLESTSLANLSSIDCTNDSSKSVVPIDVNEVCYSIQKVPFLKKSAIIETCKYCRDEVNSDQPVPEEYQIKPVKITIDGDNYLTTISIFKNIESNVVINTKSTVSVQTDICETYKDTNEQIITFKNKNLPLEKKVTMCNDNDGQTEDLCTDNKKIYGAIGQHEELRKCLIIDESDSDTDLEASGPMSVKAEVHRSYEELRYGILNTVLDVEEHVSKTRRRPRGHTPTSTDSSEKENFNPNRVKRDLIGKKKVTKK